MVREDVSVSLDELSIILFIIIVYFSWSGPLQSDLWLACEKKAPIVCSCIMRTYTNFMMNPHLDAAIGAWNY